ncbi:MAG: dihydropteroate synthase [Phenylobacterium sp.]|jgi:dihydropteroate synthase
MPNQNSYSIAAQVMGILNVTPDSFSDGGHFNLIDRAVDHCALMLTQGATIIDIGGESTRPGAVAVNEAQELQRVIPVIEALRQRFDCAISIDTSKAGVMSAAVGAGAAMINDVQALTGPGCVEIAASLDVPVWLMHMQGKPRTMQHDPVYTDVVDDVKAYFIERTKVCIKAGIKPQHIGIDPGFGFGKTVAHNYQMLNRLEEFHALGFSLLAGMSRKSMIGHVLDNTVEQRLSGSLACAVIAAMKGAQVIRVHDVKETFEALQIVAATINNECNYSAHSSFAP